VSARDLAAVNVRIILPDFLPVSMGVVSFEYVAKAAVVDFPLTPVELHPEGPRPSANPDEIDEDPPPSTEPRWL
jgi:hypothetical protein